MRNKLVIGNISGQKDCSGVLFDFMAKWKKTIMPIHLAAFLQGKNAWDGSFRDGAPKNTERLLRELAEQLLSKTKPIHQFKLFVKKMDYCDPRLCQVQAINDFYEEVFQYKLSLNRLTKKLPIAVTDKFMFFPKEFNFSSSHWIEAWNEYRASEADGGLRRCEPLNFKYGTRPENFLIYNIRSEKQNYLITYEERYSEKITENIDRFTYDLKNYKSQVKPQKGVTLREAFILSLFHYWKNEKYFTSRGETDKYLIIPCYGSVCRDSDYDEKYRPIPIIVLSEQALSSTWASTKGGPPHSGLTKIYTVEKTFTF